MQFRMMAPIIMMFVLGLTCVGKAIGQEYIEIPPPKFEVITAEPSGDHVWIKGHWRRSGNEWVWVPGRWVKPAKREARWEPGKWEYKNGSWVWVEGHWEIDHTRTGYIVKETYEIPARPARVVKVEERPAAPGPGYVWVKGEWDWDGEWKWRRGYWIKKENPKAVWVPGRWEKYSNGVFGHKRWIPGHWRVPSGTVTTTVIGGERRATSSPTVVKEYEVRKVYYSSPEYKKVTTVNFHEAPPTYIITK